MTPRLRRALSSAAPHPETLFFRSGTGRGACCKYWWLQLVFRLPISAPARQRILSAITSLSGGRVEGIRWTGRGRAVAMLWPDKWPMPIPVNRVRAALHPLGVIRLRWAAMRDPDELRCEDGSHPTRPHFHWGFPERLPPVLHAAPWYRS